jgi:V8-like Glu-specific endopeptidase
LKRLLKTQLIVACSILLGCNTESPDNKLDSVFGTDGRVVLPSTYTFIGDYGGVCTAFAIGPRLLMTAAHCTFGDIEHKWTAHGSGKIYTSTLLQRGMSSPKVRRKLFFAEIMNDWAVLKLDPPVDRWLELDTSATEGDKIAVAGYSEDIKGASGHNGCIIKQIKYNVIGHNCDMRDGASGGPVMKRKDDRWFVVGIQSTENCDGTDCDHSEWTDRNSNHATLLTEDIASIVRSYANIYPK